MELNHSKTRLNKEENRFELKLDGDVAFIDFKMNAAGDVYLVHTKVPLVFEGKGVGHKLVRETLEIIENDGRKIIPLCPFVRSFVVSNKDDYQNLLSPKAKLE